MTVSAFGAVVPVDRKDIFPVAGAVALGTEFPVDRTAIVPVAGSTLPSNVASTIAPAGTAGAAGPPGARLAPAAGWDFEQAVRAAARAIARLPVRIRSKDASPLMGTRRQAYASLSAIGKDFAHYEGARTGAMWDDNLS
jgi:hypothetical protein